MAKIIRTPTSHSVRTSRRQAASSSLPAFSCIRLFEHRLDLLPVLHRSPAHVGTILLEHFARTKTNYHWSILTSVKDFQQNPPLIPIYSRLFIVQHLSRLAKPKNLEISLVMGTIMFNHKTLVCTSTIVCSSRPKFYHRA